MSASTKRKNRLAAQAAGTDKKLLAMQEQAQKKAKSKRKWTIGTIAVVVVIALVILLDSSFLNHVSTAVTIGDRAFSPAEVEYYYAEQFYTFYQNYGSYASMFGLDVSGGMAGLASQECSMTDGGTWRDYFLESAYSQMTSITAACSYAEQNGITLDADELAEIDEGLAALKETAKSTGYGSVNKYLSACYGKGVNKNTLRKASADQALAAKTAEAVEDSFVYTPEQIAEKYASFEGSYDVFKYVYYLVEAETVDSTDADGNVTSAATEETLAAAKATAESIRIEYSKLSDIADVTERMNAAVAAVVEGAEATESGPVQGSSLGEFEDWAKSANTKAGDVRVFRSSDDTGCYVAAFDSREIGDYPTVSVRHILIKAVASEDGTYTDEAKEAAKARIEEIKAEWEAGEKTEESFAALAEKYSEDGGSNTNGGLYENIAKDQMVENFNDFCFAPHQHGDTDVVYGETTGYAGYHLVYFVGEGENYCDYVAETTMKNEAIQAWLDELISALTPVEGYGKRFVG